MRFTASGLLNAREQVPADAAGIVIEKARAILADNGITVAATDALEDRSGWLRIARM